MRKYLRNRIMLAGVVLLLVALVAQMSAWLGAPQDQGLADTKVEAPMLSSVGYAPSGQEAVKDTSPAFVVGRSLYNDTSPALRDIPPVPYEKPTSLREMPEPRGEDGMNKPMPDVIDPVVQRSFGGSPFSIPAPSANFEGINNRNGVYPPDTNGDVGPNHYVQMVNLSLQVFNKSGGSLYGPVNSNTIWSGFGGPCQTRNDGDPVVLYNSIADRWLLSQFTSASPYGECVAISTSPDPTGSYHRYFFQFDTSIFYDYPHLGVWPDGYYLAANRFGTISFQGPSAIVLNRAAMLVGSPATFQRFNLSSSFGTLLPSDLDGAALPPAGSPNFFMARGSSALQMWKFHVDWANPGNTTFTGPTNLPVAAYSTLCAGTRSCIPQPGTSVGLDAIGDRLMFRLAYRNFGSHEALVVNHTVNAGGGLAGVRWYEVRNPNGTTTVHQQGTYAPDSTHRWMGSVAMDGSGNMGMVFSVSSSSVFPGIRYTGRLASDPLGQMSQGETTLMAGSGVQTGTASRWGDYADISIDPTDDCTFWMTTEYIQTTGGAPWRTRIGSFKFPGCGGAPVPTATPAPPTPTSIPPTATNTPNPGAPDFSLSVNPSSATVVRPGSTQYTVNLASLNGFSGNVNLSVSGLPSKTTGSFNPGSVTLSSGGTGTSTLTISAERGGPTGTFVLTVTGTSGSITHSQNVTLVITR